MIIIQSNHDNSQLPPLPAHQICMGAPSSTPMGGAKLQQATLLCDLLIVIDGKYF